MARIVFDLDGTLVDSAPTLAEVANRMLAELGRAPVPLETFVDFVGHGVRRLVEQFLRTTGGLPKAGLEASYARFRDLYDADPVTGTTAYVGVRQALARLIDEGHGLGVCTQKSNAPALSILRTLELMPPIAAFTGGESLDVLKPDPRMFRHTANQLPPGPALFVGDSLVDAETARAAAVPFLLHTPGYRRQPITEVPHAAAFEDFSRLPELIADVLDGRVRA